MSEQLAGRDLAWLERRRAELFGLISQVGDFRRGALNAVWRKCGKLNCACAQPGERGAHGAARGDRRRGGRQAGCTGCWPARHRERAGRAGAGDARRVGGGRRPAAGSRLGRRR